MIDVSTRFRVSIPYVEPTYQVRAGSTKPFQATYDVQAATAAEAIELAMRRFDGDAEESGVGWIREPLTEAIQATPLQEEPNS